MREPVETLSGGVAVVEPRNFTAADAVAIMTGATAREKVARN